MAQNIRYRLLSYQKVESRKGIRISKYGNVKI